MNGCEMYWLIGVLEGDGSFYMKNTPMITLKMQDKDTIQLAADLMGCEKISGSPGQQPHYKYMYMARICGYKAADLMARIYSHMSLRRQGQIQSILARYTGPGKLVPNDVREIRKLYATGNYSQNQLAAKFGVVQSNIHKIIHRGTWKYIKP